MAADHSLAEWCLGHAPCGVLCEMPHAASDSPQRNARIPHQRLGWAPYRGLSVIAMLRQQCWDPLIFTWWHRSEAGQKWARFST